MSQGDGDANVRQQFERDFAEMLQETLDLQQPMANGLLSRGHANHHRSPPGPHVCESDPGYIKWILAWADSLPEDVADFASYA